MSRIELPADVVSHDIYGAKHGRPLLVSVHVGQPRPHAPGLFDFVNTYIVLQHIPVDRGISLAERLIRKVRPGGGFLIHFSVADESFLRGSVVVLRDLLPYGDQIAEAIRKKPLRGPAMQMGAYSLPRILAMLERHSITEMLLFTQRHGRFLTVGLIGKTTTG